MFLSRLALCALAAVITLVALPARAETLQTRYTISILGLPVGRADFTTQLTDSRYSVAGTLRSAGLGALVSSTNGTSSSEGQVRGTSLVSSRYRLAYTSDGKSWSSDVRLTGGAVASSTVSPPLRQPRPDDFVEVARAQLRNVLDPLTSMMIKAPADRLCNRTLRIYDGWSRLDLKLSSGGTAPYRTEGFSGDATICNAKVQPVGGYRRNSSGLKYLQAQTIQIWFAPVGDSGIHAPVYVRIPTKIGPLTLNAATFARS